MFWTYSGTRLLKWRDRYDLQSKMIMEILEILLNLPLE